MSEGSNRRHEDGSEPPGASEVGANAAGRGSAGGPAGLPSAVGVAPAPVGARTESAGGSEAATTGAGGLRSATAKVTPAATIASEVQSAHMREDVAVAPA